MLRLYEVRLEIEETIDELKNKCEKLLNTKISTVKLIKKSIDARKKHDIYYSCTVDCETSDNIKIPKKVRFSYVEDAKYEFPIVETNKKIVIVGSGPAGLFSALCLARNGANPVVIERGADVDERTKKIDHFFINAVLDTDTNVQFGEGGAGTFSDGKLNTGINDERIKFVLREFVRYGAPENILYDAAPHIGTDVLRKVVKNIRKEIERLGGKVFFKTKLENILTEDGGITGITVVKGESKETMECDCLILAIGHSARDTVRMLYSSGVRMEKKIFSVGVRIEHLQEDINNAMYGKFSDKLPAAPYKLWTHLNNGSSLYTFCMCPGGYVMNSASENGRVVTNGMSFNARDGKNANSALLVNVQYRDETDIFEGMKLQEEIERKAFEAGGGNYKMPIQLLGDFLENKISDNLGRIEPTVAPGYEKADINSILPEYVSESIKNGIISFEKKIKGFSVYDAVLTAPETRSSSPVKFIRDKETLQTNIKGIFSAGEGGGHAGGITSSAVDGIKVAEAVLR